MIQTSLVTNFDLFIVGIAVTTTLLLGFLVFFRNPRGFTSRAFLFFTITSAIWSVFNYLNYQFSDYSFVLWTIRFVMFFAVWQSFAFFLLMWVIPYGKVFIPRSIFLGILPLVVVTSLLTLTPFVFSGIHIQTFGQVAVPRPAAAIIVFAALSISLVVAGVYVLFKKIFRSVGSERKQLFLIALGMIAMFILVIVFNFFLPVLFENTRFIPLSALFIFPFVLFFYYAIARYHFLNVKVIATELAAFFLITATLSEILFSPVNSVLFVLRIGIFSFVLAFSILLIRSVLQEVRQREQLEDLSQKLAIANDELQSLNQFKTQLLSLASHQIKSPLAAIKGFASILLDGLYGPLDIKVRDVVEKIKYSTNDLVDLINSLLDLRKVEEGKMEYQFVRVDIVPLIRELVDRLGSLALEKNISFSFETPAFGSAFVSADAQKLKQVFQNLIDNAIKYTPSGFVKVTLELSRDGFQFCVTDSGLGISTTLVPQLFEEFVRDDRVKQHIRGTGLGLYIARKIIEAHGGRVWAQSAGEGKGSQFYVWLPKG